MTTNLLSVIEQQQKALKGLCEFSEAAGFPTVAARAAIAASQQALEQMQGDVEYYGLEPWERDKQSPTAGMNIAQRILHVGGRNNEAGYVEFGSIQAVEALVRQVLRDLPSHPQATEPAPSTAGDRDRTIVSLPIPASASDLKSDIAELIQSHKYKGLRSCVWAVQTVHKWYPRPCELNDGVFRYAGDPISEAVRVYGWVNWLTTLMQSVSSLDEVPMNEQDYNELLRWTNKP